jgi:hypothetical protein
MISWTILSTEDKINLEKKFTVRSGHSIIVFDVVNVCGARNVFRFFNDSASWNIHRNVSSLGGTLIFLLFVVRWCFPNADIVLL